MRDMTQPLGPLDICEGMRLRSKSDPSEVYLVVDVDQAHGYATVRLIEDAHGLVDEKVEYDIDLTIFACMFEACE